MQTQYILRKVNVFTQQHSGKHISHERICAIQQIDMYADTHETNLCKCIV